MNLENQNIEKIKNSKDPNEINDFLIRIGNVPKLYYLPLLNYFIENPKIDFIAQIKINVIWALGQLGKIEGLEEKHIEYLVRSYYNSDRWERDEIIKAFGQISNNMKLSKDAIELLSLSLKDDYLPIIISSLRSLQNINDLPENIIKNLIFLLDSSENEVIKSCK